MATVFDVSAQYRRELLRLEAKATERILKAYAIAWEEIDAELQKLLTAYLSASAKGETIKRSWLDRQGRLEALRDQTARAMQRFGQQTSHIVIAGQESAIERGIRHAEGLVRTSVAGTPKASIGTSWNRVPEESLRHLVGTLSDGSPLRDVLRKFGGESAGAVETKLIEGLSMGRNPRETARRMAAAVEGASGQTRTKALTISRTETLRPYRSASLENYQANSDVVSGWMWNAALDDRTCPVCWAMHGTIHELSEEFGSHPNCRCSPVPIVKPEFAMTDRKVETGEERFARLPEESQLSILGPSKLAAYQAGEIRLSDLVGTRQDDRWGLIRGEVSLDRAIAGARKRAA